MILDRFGTDGQRQTKIDKDRQRRKKTDKDRQRQTKTENERQKQRKTDKERQRRIIYLYIFKDYVSNVCRWKGCEMPRWNFTDFFHR